MIQVTPQMRILVAIEAVDGRKYAPSTNMQSCCSPRPEIRPLARRWTAHNGATLGLEAWPTICPAAGSDRVGGSVKPGTPRPPVSP
jgi:hypothetical protein